MLNVPEDLANHVMDAVFQLTVVSMSSTHVYMLLQVYKPVCTYVVLMQCFLNLSH